jgi:CheY-like chemotaxis protein
MMMTARILIVEDERVVAEDLSRTLVSLGYEIAGIAGSGEDAITFAEREKPDLILMDIMLSGKMDGISAAERIQTIRTTPIIYVTAYADDLLLARAKKTGPFGYIVKPFNEREIRSNIEIALYRHRLDGEIEKRDAILLALGSGIEWFLRQFADHHRIVPRHDPAHSGEPGYRPILESLGNAMDLARIALFRYNGTDRSMLTLADEWTFQDSAGLVHSPLVRKIAPSSFGLEPHMHDLARGAAVTLGIGDFAPEIRSTFAAYRFTCMAVLEIEVREMPYGLIFFVDGTDRSWPAEEIEAMHIAANILGSAIGLSELER